MKKYLIVILVFNFACIKEIQITSEGKNISYKMGKESSKTSDAVIHFMDGFSGDVTVYKRGELIVEKEMSTNESSSYAGHILISDLKEGEPITIKFKDELVTYSFNQRYPEMEIYNFPNSIKVNFSKINRMKSYE
jgi:hypothetical protein